MKLQHLCNLHVRYHLKGIKAGYAEIFVDNLPCLPDNIRRSSSGGYWIACGTARFDGTFNTYDFISQRPWIRWIASKVSTDFAGLHVFFLINCTMSNVLYG